MRAVFFILGVTALFPPGTAEAQRLVLDGAAHASIVVPDRATTTERFAAGELQAYLRRIAGAELAILPESASKSQPRLLIGATTAGRQIRSQRIARDPEAFAVRSVGGDLVLVGATDRSTLYAVYDFLEDDLGCRWLGPGPAWEVVPQRPVIELGPLDRNEAPAMKYRFLRMTVSAKPGTWDSQAMDWAVKQKINIAAGWPPETLPTSFEHRGGFRAWMNPHLTIPMLLPASEHFQEHPDWYAMVRGERRRIAKGREQLCTTNPEVVRRIAAGIGRTFDLRPEMDFAAVVQEDGTAFCECDRCRALDTGEIWPSRDNLPVITERWLSFVNAVARQLQTTHLGKKVYTLAYHQTFRPPDPKVIRPEPNVMIQVVNSRPNYVCFVHRFEEESCPRHVKFRRGLEDWIAMTPGGVLVYEYDPHSTFCSMPYPAAYKFIEDIQYLHRAGVVGYEGQSSPSIWGTYGINHYVIAKMTWNPGLDGEGLVKDYCQHAFGNGAEAMLRFLKAIDRGLVGADHITDGIWSYMTPEVMAEARKHLDAAHAAVQDPAVKARLRTYEIGFHFGELGSRAWHLAQEGITARDANRLRQAIELAESACQFVLDQQEKDPHYAAMPGKLTDYVQTWKRQLAQIERRDP